MESGEDWSSPRRWGAEGARRATEADRRGAPGAGARARRAAGRERSQELVAGRLTAPGRLPVGELPEELREQLTDAMLDELLAGKRGEAEILGPAGCWAT